MKPYPEFNSETRTDFFVASKTNAEELVRLINSGYRGEESKKGWTTEAEYLDGVRISVNEMNKIIESPNSVMITAVIESKILGCVYLENKTHTAYLGMLTVNPNFQSLGLGKKLISFAESYVIDNWHLNKIEMTVISIRKELIMYYNRRGYFATGEKRAFPYHELKPSDAKRKDLEFIVLEKSF